MYILQRLRLTQATLLIASCAATIGIATPAQADPVSYDFSFSETLTYGPGVGSFSGTFLVDSGIIVGISGSGSTIGTITSLDNSFQGNRFSATAPYLDFWGVDFNTSQVGLMVLEYDGSYSAYTPVYYSEGNLTVTLTGTTVIVPEPDTPVPVSNPVPEPGAMALTALALLAAAGVRRGKRPGSNRPATTA